MDNETLIEYIEKRLLKAGYTSFPSGNTHIPIATADGISRLSESHSLPDGMRTFSNMCRSQNREFLVEEALVEFYRNSLAAREPMVADTIICHKDFYVPNFDNHKEEDKTLSMPTELKKITWDHDAWFIFNSGTGLLSNKWWHIYGYIPPQK